jgi:hypothetical protein
VQGFHDVTLFGIVAFSSLMSGKVLNAWGWDALNSLFWPVALFCLRGTCCAEPAGNAAARLN